MVAAHPVTTACLDLQFKVIHMTSILRSLSGALLVSLLASACLFAATPSTQPLVPTTVPYGRPAVREITRTLEQVKLRLEARMVMRITDPGTTQPVSDPPDAQNSGERPFSSVDYPAGVAYAGMLSAGDATGDKAFSDFVARRFQFFATHLGKFPTTQTSQLRNPLRNLILPTSLDSCGAIGAALIKARQAGIGPDLKPVIDRFAEFVSHGQFRLDDGTLARGRPFHNSIWADDMYMSVPLLAQLGVMSGQRSYFDDAARQVTQMSARLFIPTTGLFAHGCNPQLVETQPHYCWGRANGWCIMAMVELLDVLPADHPQRGQILKLLAAHAKGLASVQSSQGLWHQILDRNDSYLETSCSAMFTYALARAVNKGWLDAGTFGPVAIAGWDGLTTRITSEGGVTGTCIGTGYASDYIYYYNRPAVDDVHGYGPVLFAGAEMIRLLNNPRFRIQGIPGQPITVQEATPPGAATRESAP
jgi:unsaturated rhamnogalacturonyl hydrolase